MSLTDLGLVVVLTGAVARFSTFPVTFPWHRLCE
jgi:hypothetical protein